MHVARALNKSLRASVRGVDRATRPAVLLNRSVFRPRNSQQPPADRDLTREQSGTQDNEAAGLQQESFTRRIIQHYDALSRKNTPPIPRHTLGIQRHGAAVEKKTSTAAFSRTLRTTTTTTISTPHRHLNVTITDMSSSQKSALAPIELRSESQHALRNESHLDLLGAQVYPTPTPKPVDFNGTKSVRRDRSTNLAAPGKRQEDIYLSQARLLQWHAVSKRAQAHFQEQEKSAKVRTMSDMPSVCCCWLTSWRHPVRYSDTRIFIS